MMSENFKDKLTNLDSITLSIVNGLGKLGVFHYNKLTYLFEYFFIKNFGFRFTKEVFVKLPHGPVITNYKRQILNLSNLNLIETDEELLKKTRHLDDDSKEKIWLFSNDKTINAISLDPMVNDFLNKILNRFANLDCDELESIVYQTSPVKSYLTKVKTGLKPEIGSYVLTDCIKMSKYKDNPKVTGRKLALEHIRKYPNINYEQHHKLISELNDLKKLRPEWV